MPVDPGLAKDILAAVEAGFAAQVSFLEDLVRLPSLRGQEHTAQDFLFEAMKGRGLTMDRWAIEVADIEGHPGFSPVKVNYANAINVVGSHRPRAEAGRSLILNGHVDVVPSGPAEMWTRPPFEPWTEGDWLHGRGSGDMKAGLAINLFALDALAALGLQPAARVHVQSVTEEECTGNGALSCLVRGYRADAALITEPEGERLVRANCGVIWFRVHVRGLPVHVAVAGSGANAIEATFPIMQALRRLEARWNEERRQHPHFAGLDHPINLNFGKIAGGDWASSVPAWCSFDCRIAIYPGVEPRDAARQIEDAVRAAARDHPFLANNPPEVEFNGFFAQGYVLEEGSEAEQVLARAHAGAIGSRLDSMVAPAYLDGRVFVLYGGIPCLVYGPAARAIHGFDEAVSLSSMRRVTGAVALFVAEWCGVEERPR